MRILLTGATGTLGSQVLFSLLQERHTEIDHIYLPVRPKKGTAPLQRIKNMLQSPFAPAHIKEQWDQMMAKITVVNAQQLLDPASFLKGRRLSHFIHSAGLVNLSTAQEAKDEIFKENLDFTKDILNAYRDHMGKFIYISTAFSAGDVGGVLQNDYLKTAPDTYRNHYEASKFAAEKYVAAWGRDTQLPVQILRPSVLGGNILGTPCFFISKYMVFYLFAKFFHRNGNAGAVRITAAPQSGLNIIPTDYAAMVICRVFDRDIDQLNIVHHTATNVQQGIEKILEAVNFDNFSFTATPLNRANGFENKLERFYYSTIGLHLTPYLTGKPCHWDTTLLEAILPIPAYDLETYLQGTIQFAKVSGFKNQPW
ncbi:SDR family oxidoreductase [Maribacter sp. 2307ULW6-5]|uniref:SDR family oxidoreductase n=1 Tax=Maribacter sp. 2307ULW6-5 TaxID=3386275 RepID=UPI0039BD8D98